MNKSKRTSKEYLIKLDNFRTFANTANKINKLVTVFALILCTLDNIWLGDKPGFPPLPLATSVTGDNNWLAFVIAPRHCASAVNKLTIP